MMLAVESNQRNEMANEVETLGACSKRVMLSKYLGIAYGSVWLAVTSVALFRAIVLIMVRMAITER